MSYIGNQILGGQQQVEFFSGNGSTTQFALSYPTGAEPSVLVCISGVKQQATSYFLSGGNLNFTAPPPSGSSNIEVTYLGFAALTTIDQAVVKTSTVGSAALPTGTTGQRDGSPATGYLRFNSTLTAFEGYNGTAWGLVGGGATGGGQDQVFMENQLIVTTNYTLSSGKSAVSVGPITVNGGVTVTVPSGHRWVIL